ncbi:MAG: hypothetical protein ACRDIX_05545 [Actinomycetota bacterium]
MYAASLVFLAAAAVTLAVGIQGEGLRLLFVSVACSVLAAGSVSVAVVRRVRRGRSAAGR